MRYPRRIRPFGPTALLLEWEPRIDPAINAGVHAWAAAVRDWPEIAECVPAYASLLLELYRPVQIAAVRRRLYALSVPELPAASGYLHELPVHYAGPDLEEVTQLTGLSVREVIDLHAGREYRVYMLGFRPGFAFLGELDERLWVGRLDRARTRVQAGSLGIANRQTGLYPDAGPGGWRLIGHCPLPLLHPRRAEVRLRAGDRLCFRPITAGEHRQLSKYPPAWPARD